MSFEEPSKEAIEYCHQNIGNYIVKTPVLYDDYLNEILGLSTYFKCENFQKIGAFKARGALNAALSLDSDQLQRGLCTHSSGNHAQAIALAAKILGTKASIVMPKNAPKVKKEGVKRLGAEIVECEPNIKAREEGVASLINEKGMSFIHPFNNAQVITGQATAAKELIEEINDLDVIITPLGGGGLLSGTSLSARYFGKKIDVYGAEPEGAADGILSFKSGTVQNAPYIKTIADGLLTPLSSNTLSIIKKGVKDILIVSDDEIKDALKLAFQHLKIVIEPSSATVLAALIKNKEQFQGKKVGLIISGGNVDLDFFRTLI